MNVASSYKNLAESWCTLTSPAQTLRQLLAGSSILRTPCCHDSLSARLIQQSGLFPATFLSGFGVAATKALPDVGLVSFEESMQICRNILNAVSCPNELSASTNAFPVIIDADTGYGNEINVRRTVVSLARAGAAGLMLEDQENPKRCGHGRGKSVVPIDRALSRIRAACDVRKELGLDVVIIARTDARAQFGIEHAVERARAFHAEGAEVTFVEAPASMEELELVGRASGCGFKMANMLLHGATPAVASTELKQMGFHLAAYPFDLLVASMTAVNQALVRLHEEKRDIPQSEVDAMWETVGFNRYYEMEDRYKPKS